MLSGRLCADHCDTVLRARSHPMLCAPVSSSVDARSDGSPLRVTLPQCHRLRHWAAFDDSHGAQSIAKRLVSPHPSVVGQPRDSFRHACVD